MTEELRNKVKNGVVITALICGAISIGANIVTAESNVWIDFFDVMTAVCWILWIRMKFFPSNQYNENILASLLITTVIAGGLCLIIFVLSFGFDKAGESIRELDPVTLWSEFITNAQAMTRGFGVWKDAAVSQDPDIVTQSGSNFFWLVAGLGLVISTFTILKKGLYNSIPNEVKSGFKKLFVWIIILAAVGLVCYFGYKFGLWSWATELIKSKNS